MSDAVPEDATCGPALAWKLWIYTDYDCNLRCSYCVAKSSANTPLRPIALANVRQLVDEAVTPGLTADFFSGREDVFRVPLSNDAGLTVSTSRTTLVGASES